MNCRLADSAQRLPPLVALPRDAELVEIRNGHKAYTRMQVRPTLYDLDDMMS